MRSFMVQAHINVSPAYTPAYGRANTSQADRAINGNEVIEADEYINMRQLPKCSNDPYLLTYRVPGTTAPTNAPQKSLFRPQNAAP